MLTEADITKQIRDVLNAAKVFHWKQWQGPMSQPRGVSDILGIHEGRMFAIEVKKPGWTIPKPDTKQYKHFSEQNEFLRTVNRNGGIAFFAQSAEEVAERLGLKVKLYPLFNRS
jgi:penicillin-binding protein-related factor A (putative recombinase)